LIALRISLEMTGRFPADNGHCLERTLDSAPTPKMAGMSRSFDVCIRGNGVVGRTLALLLAQNRLQVALAGRAAVPAGSSNASSTPTAPDVRAYALNAASRRTLQKLRAWPEEAAATPVTAMQVWGDDGGRLDFDARAVATGADDSALAWIVDVPALEQRLIEAARYQPQIELVEEPVKAKLTVICEGGQSVSRDVWTATQGTGAAPEWTSQPYSQKAIAARLEADLPHGGVARQWFMGGDVLALLPMGGVTGRSLALVWSVSIARADVLLALDEAAFCAELQAFCHPFTENLVLTGARAAWPLALARADRWVGAGWALAGDAAHTVHPLAGQGLNLGLADAACLASTLAEREYWREIGDEKLLRRYERARKANVAAISAVTDGLHGLFSQTNGPWPILRNMGMNSFSRSGWLKNWAVRQAAGL
jgi:2-polyprenyl-6-methoxyphenol hydroxylase-like FAD-dependent oxidoreductase